ncbi:MAG: ATP-binding protein [Elusimicrobiota bacterium]
MGSLKYRKIVDQILKYIDDTEIIAIHGSRQVGKTSVMHYIIDNHIAKKAIGSNILYMDLEDFALLDICNRGTDEVIKYIKSKGADLTKRVYLLIDEVQYLENPSSFLKLFHDRYKENVKLIVSGSSSFLIKKKFKDSLVGRTIDFELFTLDFKEFLEFKGLSYDLAYPAEAIYRELLPLYEEFIIYGGYPAIVLEEDAAKKETKLKQIINTYIKKDIRDVGSIRDINKFNNLLRILAAQSGSLVNMAELSNTVGISKNTIDEYIFIMESTYIVRRVPPFHKNIRNELTKMPKMFFEDTGMLNILINTTFSKVVTGMLFETGMYSLLRKNINLENIYFWRTIKGHEIDFVLNFPAENKLVPLEIKLNYSKKYLTSVNYFLEKYSLKKAFFCSLNKKEAADTENISVIFPWDIYSIEDFIH